jgi:hypothetical protein
VVFLQKSKIPQRFFVPIQSQVRFRPVEKKEVSHGCGIGCGHVRKGRKSRRVAFIEVMIYRPF